MLRRRSASEVATPRVSGVLAFDPALDQKERLLREVARERGFTPRPENSFARPARLRMVSYPITIPVAGVVTQVLQQNLSRLRVLIPNTTGAVIFVSFSKDDLTGIPVNNNASYMETVGTVTIDGLYVRTSLNNVTVRAYEGVAIFDVMGT